MLAVKVHFFFSRNETIAIFLYSSRRENVIFTKFMKKKKKNSFFVISQKQMVRCDNVDDISLCLEQENLTLGK